MNNAIDVKTEHISALIFTVNSSSIDALQECITTLNSTDSRFDYAMPIIIKIADGIAFTPTNLAVLIELITQQQMVVVAIKTADQTLVDYANIVGLAVLSLEHSVSMDAVTIKEFKQSKPEKLNKIKPSLPMFINRTITGSEQIYAQQQDLIISCAVELGGEVISEQSVFIYDRVEGKVFAGAAGDEQAIIFIKDFRAELVCIAGVYKTFTTLPERLAKASVKIGLKQGVLTFDVNELPLNTQ